MVCTSAFAAGAFAADAKEEQSIPPDRQGSVIQNTQHNTTKSSADTNGSKTDANQTNLNGSTAEEAKLDSDTKLEINASQTLNPTTLQQSDSTPLQGKVERKHSPGFSLFGKRWTSEVYRSLNYGILGVVMVRHPFSKTERVGEVFPDCPAALAGIKTGDIVVSYANHVIDGHETQRSTWHTADGAAGTHVDYVVRRHGTEIKFDLTRMNIEDIQNSHIRRLYERMLSHLGPPGEVQQKLQERGIGE